MSFSDKTAAMLESEALIDLAIDKESFRLFLSSVRHRLVDVGIVNIMIGSNVTPAQEAIFLLDLAEWVKTQAKLAPTEYPSELDITAAGQLMGSERLVAPEPSPAEISRGISHVETLIESSSLGGEKSTVIKCKNPECESHVAKTPDEKPEYSVMVVERQIRRNDEPATAFYTCTTCWTEWRD